ncbi:hypothetical protein KGF54_003270 [Candida jiufengensis]|uniref:uncharacterized protein n=1 Tax=Candida jiufengensis TaxID=497108 RepID=UPI002224F62C|nr:uncharacterized protein KGF54_003270 [Candida jiufengensis]KAI5952403.1 hypothetical protein KGF54_003270 [Candida jiufengensis]
MSNQTSHSRRNSLNSISTTNSSRTKNEILLRSTSTDNLIIVDDKFLRKPTKKSNISPVIPSAEFNNNGNNGSRNNSINSSNSYYSKEGVYYFPNGEIFRPRTNPIKRNRPSKVNTEANNRQQNGNTKSNQHNHHQNSHQYPPPQHQKQKQQVLSFHNRLDSPVSSQSSTSTNSMQHSNGSYTYIPKSASLQNVKSLNMQNLTKTIRDNKNDDIHSNITIQDQSNNFKQPFESYRNNHNSSSSSLNNSGKLQCQNITKTEQRNSNSFSSTNSNVSNVLHNNGSNSQINRSMSNTPSTSINEEQINNHQLNNNHQQHNLSREPRMPGMMIHLSNSSKESNITSNSKEYDLENKEESTLDSNDLTGFQIINSHQQLQNKLQYTNSRNSASLSSESSVNESNMSNSVPQNEDDYGNDVTDDTGLSTLNEISEEYHKSTTPTLTQFESSDAGHPIDQISHHDLNTNSRNFDDVSHENEFVKKLDQELPINHNRNYNNNYHNYNNYDDNNNNNINTRNSLSNEEDGNNFLEAGDRSNTSYFTTYESSNISNNSVNVNVEELSKPQMPTLNSLNNQSEDDIFGTPLQTPEIDKSQPKFLSTIHQTTEQDGNFNGSAELTSPINLGNNGQNSFHTVPVKDIPNRPPPLDIDDTGAAYSSTNSSPPNDIERTSSEIYPEPTVDFVDHYLNDSSPESVVVKERLPVNNEAKEKEPNENDFNKNVKIDDDDDTVPIVIDIPLQPADANTTGNISNVSEVYELNSSAFNKYIHDEQKEVPPRGDVTIMDHKIKKHHRNASSASSADFFNKPGTSTTNSEVNRSPKEGTPPPQVFKRGNSASPKTPVGQTIPSQLNLTPPKSPLLIPPPPIEKSPNMKVKGRSKKKKSTNEDSASAITDLSLSKTTTTKSMISEDLIKSNSRPDSSKVATPTTEANVETPKQKVKSLLGDESATPSTTPKRISLTRSRSLTSLLRSKSSSSSSSPKTPKSDEKFKSPIIPSSTNIKRKAPISDSSKTKSPIKATLLNAPPTKSPSSSTLSSSISIRNFKSFFKKFRPPHSEKLDSTTTTSPQTVAAKSPTTKSNQSTPKSTTSSSSGKRFRFNFRNKEDTPKYQIVVKTKPREEPKPAEPAQNFKIDSLPSFEPESTGLFDDMLTTFDEKFENELTPTKPPDFLKKLNEKLTTSNGITSNIDMKNVSNQPFLKDDELTKDQIKDQKIQDTNNNILDFISDEDLKRLTAEPSNEVVGHHLNPDLNNDDAGGTMNSFLLPYIDDNFMFLKNEEYWTTMDETALKEHISKSEKRLSNQFQEHEVAPNDERSQFIGSSPVKVLDVNQNDINGISNGSIDQEQSSCGTVIVIDNQELNYFLKNMSDEDKHNLPIHLKYIKQFQDDSKTSSSSSIEVEINKFKDITNQPPRTKETTTTNSSILKKKKNYRFQIPTETSSDKSSIKLSRVPTTKKQVNFQNKIQINETFSSDLYKRYNKSVTQYNLTDPLEINMIKNEVNYYKCNEMLVHESSQNNTHFYY